MALSLAKQERVFAGWARNLARALAVCLLAALILPAAFAAAQTGREPARQIVVGSEQDYPPFALGKTEADAGGFTVDLWKAVASEKNLAYTLRVGPFGQLLEEFKDGRIDVLLNLAQSEERRAFADFSVPHMIVHGAVFVRRGEAGIRSEADLQGKSIIVLNADLAHDYAISKGWEKQLVPVKTAAEGLKLLASGKHDAMLLSKLVGMQTLPGLGVGNIRALDAKAGFSQKFSFAVRKGDTDLLAGINEGLALAKSDGRYDASREKWFGLLETSGITIRHLLKYLWPLAVGLVLLGSIFALRQRDQREVQKRLRESEERLRLALCGADQGIYDLNVQTGACITTPEYALMLGYDPARFVETKTRLLDRMHPDDRERTLARYEDYIAGILPDYRAEFRQRTRTGEWKWILSLGSVLARTADGRPLRMLGTHTDISARKKTEEALQESELRFRTLTSHAPVGILVTDSQGDCLFVNECWCAMAGVKPGAAARRGWLDGVHEEDRERVYFAWRVAAAGGRPFSEDFRMKTPAGRITFVQGTGTTLSGGDGDVKGHVGTITDVTARIQAEAELRTSEERYRGIVENAHEGIWMLDANASTTFVNRRMGDMLGYAPEEILGRNVTEFMDAEGRELASEKLESRAQGIAGDHECRFIRRDGSDLWALCSTSPLHDDKGRYTGSLAMILDITGRKRAAEALRESEERLRQSQKLEAIGQLAGGIAHDFNNILAAMMLQTELSARVPGTPAEVCENLAQIRDCCERAAKLVRQLLLFGSRQVMQLRELDLNEAVTHVSTMLRRIIGEDVQIELKLHPAPLVTRADEGMLEQVLMNLAVNARDAMPGGGWLRIETAERTLDAQSSRVHPGASPGRFVLLSVADTGTGIPADVLPRIFEPFFTTKPQGKGTGPGLATVFGIVRQHGGWLTVSSDPGQGANFQVFLPASGAAAAPPSRATAQPAADRGTETIFLVEDEPEVRTLARVILEKHGYRVIEAASGAEALVLWQKHRGSVALLLTDMVMPGGVNGQQLARRLQAEQPGLRVVIMSGYSAGLASVEPGFPDGGNVLEKPFASRQMLAAVRQGLDS